MGAPLREKKKIAQVLLRLAQVENPLVALVAGSDALSVAKGVANEPLEWVAMWRDLPTSTDGP